MGNILTPYSIAIGMENTCFLAPRFQFIGKNRINYDDLLSGNENPVHPCDYHVSQCGKILFKKIRIYKNHSNYD